MKYLLTLLLGGIISQSVIADSPPAITPPDDQEEVVYQGQNFELTASGGSTDQPDSTEGCPPWTVGELDYSFVYSGLSGTPASGELTADFGLLVSRSVGGTATVTAFASQKWTDSKGKVVTKASPPSNSVKLVAQVPTSLKFVSSTTAGDCQGSYTFTVLDQDGKPIKNAPLVLKESVPDIPIPILYADGSSQKPVDTLMGKPDGTASLGPTDGSGNIVDVPVGATGATIAQKALDKKESITSAKCGPFVHTYTSIIGPDGKTYTINFSQTQEIDCKVTYVSYPLPGATPQNTLVSP